MRAEYERRSGRPLRHLEYFRLFAAYRVAVISVLAMRHFPGEVLAGVLPTLERGPQLCIELAAAVGAVPLSRELPISALGEPAPS